MRGIFQRMCAIGAVLLWAAGLACGQDKGGGLMNTTVTQLTVTSVAFSEGGPIPARYSCFAENVSPPLKWEAGPEKTQSFAMIVEDPDAPAGVWTHWVIYDIPASSRGLPEQVPLKGDLPDGTRQGKNSSGKIGYSGPCPPSGTHRYYFLLYALDSRLDLKPGASKEELRKAMQGHIVAEGRIIGTYRR